MEVIPLIVTLKFDAYYEITNFHRDLLLKSIPEDEDSQFYFLYHRL